jgi:hypothetical protein
VINRKKKKSWQYSKFLCSFASVEIGIQTYQILLTTGEEDPSDLLSKLEEQITQVKQEASRRKEILDKMEKWMSACEEEGWLEDYNKV